LSLRTACLPPLNSAPSSACSTWLSSTRYRPFFRFSSKRRPDESAMSQKLGAASQAGQLRFTEQQGQYLAFIYVYSRIFRQVPTEADLQRHFLVTPPSIHQMVLNLERAALIRRQPGVARSIDLLVPAQDLSILQWLNAKPSSSL
jgi:DNA-binding MarR family transcriptional regulator